MRTLLAAFAITVAFSQEAVRAAGPVSWGPPSNGLRLGVGAGASSNPGTLQVVFQNTGSADVEVLLGGTTGIGPMYAMKYTSTDRAGRESEVSYFGGANFVGGYLGPLLVRLAPGETHELSLPLDKFVCVLSRKEITLDVLLQRGNSIRASLEVNGESAKWAMSRAAWRGPRQVWTGKMESGDFPGGR